MQVVRDINSCGLLIREYRVDYKQGGADSLFVDLSMADYVELIIREAMDNNLIHYPYRIVYTRDGDIMLIRTESYNDNKLRRHKASACPFRRCRYLVGPLSSTRFVIRLIGFRNADPIIRFS